MFPWVFSLFLFLMLLLFEGSYSDLQIWKNTSPYFETKSVHECITVMVMRFIHPPRELRFAVCMLNDLYMGTGITMLFTYSHPYSFDLWTQQKDKNQACTFWFCLLQTSSCRELQNANLFYLGSIG